MLSLIPSLILTGEEEFGNYTLEIDYSENKNILTVTLLTTGPHPVKHNNQSNKNLQEKVSERVSK